MATRSGGALRRAGLRRHRPRPTRRATSAAGGGGGAAPRRHARDRRQHHRDDQHPPADLLFAARQRPLRENRPGPLQPRPAPAPAAAPRGVGRGDPRLHQRQPDHQPDRRDHHLHHDDDHEFHPARRDALRGRPGAARRPPRLNSARRRDPRRGDRRHRRRVRRGPAGGDPAGLLHRLSADREQRLTAARLWPQRATASTDNLPGGPRGRATLGGTRGAPGDPGRGDYPDHRRGIPRQPS